MSEMSVRLWLRLLSCTKLIENQIRTNLREAFDTTLPRFDVMAQLYRHPNGLRMSEVSQSLMVTGGNITGIVDLLVQEGLVERLPVPTDRRACLGKLTPAGIIAFEEMAAQHRTWVTELTDGLTENEQRQLHTLLTTLRDSVQQKLDKNDHRITA